MKPNNEICPGCKVLTIAETEVIDRYNAATDWSIEPDELRELGEKHKEARRIMECIEYRLTGINFHTECGQLRHGEYDKFFAGCDEQ